MGDRYAAPKFFFRRHKLVFAGLFFLTIVSSVVDSFSVVAFFPVFASLVGDSGDNGGILGFMGTMVDALPFESPIVGAAVFLLLVFFVKTVFTLAREIITAFFASKIHYQVRTEVMDRYANAHYQHILDNQQGTLLYNSLEAPGAVPGVMDIGSKMATAVIKSAAIIALLFAILPLAALALIVSATVYYLAMHYLSNKVSFGLGVTKTRASTSQTIVTNEFLSGFRQIITLNVAGFWLKKLDNEYRTLRSVEVKEAAWNAIPRPVMEFFALLLLLGLVLTIWITDSGSVANSLPKVGVFGVALAQLMQPLTSLGTLRLKLMTMLPVLDRIHDVVTGPIPIRSSGNHELTDFSKSIEFKDVSFGYRGREPLFQDLNLAFPKGSVTAIVGSSGAGKTTIVNLILGLFEPTGGSITVDGIQLRDITQESWFNKIGFVSQEAFTYHASVTDNVLFGREGISSEAVVEAAKFANADGFISELPNRYDTVVGERGMKVSGGQQQRLAIARALLNSPEILIFDEATSNLDSISERTVQEAIKSVSINRTVILIAHRLSTVSHADKILVFDGGRLVEQGNHSELLELNGYYSQLAGNPV